MVPTHALGGDVDVRPRAGVDEPRQVTDIERSDGDVVSFRNQRECLGSDDDVGIEGVGWAGDATRPAGVGPYLGRASQHDWGRQ